MLDSTLTFPLLECDSCIYPIHYGHVLVKHYEPVGLVLRPAAPRASYQVLLYLIEGLSAMVGLVDGSDVELMQKAF
jgi:hypothetical protein